MEYIAISSINCVSEISKQEFLSDDYLEKIDELKNKIATLFKEYGIDIDSTESTFLNVKKYAIHKCTKCNHLMIDRETNPVKADIETLDAEVIFDGANVDGKMLCEDCLPPDHRWSSQ